jgi:hypothetical protein
LEDLFSKLIGFAAIVVMLVFDWPRAIAGVMLGLVAIYSGRPWITLLIGVPVIAGLGEAVYVSTGFHDAMTRDSLILGLITAGVTSYAVMFGLDGSEIGGSGS